MAHALLGSLREAENNAVRFSLDTLNRDQLEHVAWRALTEVNRLNLEAGREVRFASLMHGFLLGAVLAAAAFLAGTLAN